MLNVLKNFGVGLLVVIGILLSIGILTLIIAGIYWLIGKWLMVAIWIIIVGPMMVWLIYDIGKDIRSDRVWNKEYF